MQVDGQSKSAHGFEEHEGSSIDGFRESDISLTRGSGRRTAGRGPEATTLVWWGLGEGTKALPERDETADVSMVR